MSSEVVKRDQTVDYADVPTTLNEQQMRAFLSNESAIHLPNHKKMDSFERQWDNERGKVANAFSPSYQIQPKVINEEYEELESQREPKLINAISTASDMPSNGTNPTIDFDRMSTITYISQKSDGDHRRNHSFKKQPIGKSAYKQNLRHMENGLQPLDDNQELPEETSPASTQPAPKSALTAQIAPKSEQLQKQNSDTQDFVSSRNPEGKLEIKQLPFSKKTHVILNAYVQFGADDAEHIIVHCLKHISVQQFLDLVRTAANDEAFKDAELSIYCADDDGDRDDDFPSPEPEALIAGLGIKNFFIEIQNMNAEQLNDIRRSTLAHKAKLPTTAYVDRMNGLQDVSEEDDFEEDEYETSGVCCQSCNIL